MQRKYKVDQKSLYNVYLNKITLKSNLFNLNVKYLHDTHYNTNIGVVRFRSNKNWRTT